MFMMQCLNACPRSRIHKAILVLAYKTCVLSIITALKVLVSSLFLPLQQ